MSAIHEAILKARDGTLGSVAVEEAVENEETPMPSAAVEFTVENEQAPMPNEPVPALEAALSSDSEVGEQLRLLRAKLRGVARKRACDCIGMVSAVAGEGKTTTAVGLACSAAKEAGKRVLLIEADVRKPSFEKLLELPVGPGLGEWLTETIEDVPLRELVDGPCLLTAGHLETPPVELLGSKRMRALLESARASFDFVLLDCPPLLPIADSVVLQDMVDGFLFVVRARWSPHDAIQRAFANLKPETVLAVLFNDYRTVLPRYEAPAYRDYAKKL